MNFEVTQAENQEENDFVASETQKYNSRFVPNDFLPLSVFCRDEDGIMGGLTGKTYWNYLDIEFLWVNEVVRKRGIATRLVCLAEEEAKRRDSCFAILDTYEFQALAFYQKMGYTLFGRLGGYCGKYERYYLKKML